MAHQLEIVNGQASMFYVGKTPWHKLGTALASPPTIEEGIRAAGLDWQVGMLPLVTVPDGRPVDHRATYRKSDGKIFGVVGPAYTPLQNVDAFRWFQPPIDAGEVVLHTAGALQEGRKVWILAKINKPALEIADGDTVERFVLLSHSHDGTQAVRAGFTPIRVVCANTLRMAHNANSDENRLVKLLHTKNVTTALDALRDTMRVVPETALGQHEDRSQLGHGPARKFVLVLVLHAQDNLDVPAQVGVAHLEACQFAILLGSGLKPRIGSGKTLWDGYNGVTEYLNSQHGRTQETRLDALWFGQSAQVSQKALEVALTMAA